ncbi:uncharacterized protein C1orf105 homolog [Castor canadensis]|uniref:Uncharacterized protein C1orf105 homolog n=1 Tax=Castor canadensis TaxID=51338 RepID=A0AC58K7J0_CASCN
MGRRRKRATLACKAGNRAGRGRVGLDVPRGAPLTLRTSPARRRPSPSLGPAGTAEDKEAGNTDTHTELTCRRALPGLARLGGQSALPRPRGRREVAAAPSWSLLSRRPAPLLCARDSSSSIRKTADRHPKGGVSVPKFHNVPWFSEASLINKPLVLSLPKRSPQSSATFLTSYKKNMDLPISCQVPDVLSKTRKNPELLRNRKLCSTCRELKMIKPTTVVIPHDLKLSFENFMRHRTRSSHQSQAQSSCNDIPTENIHYRLPIVGPRTAVFHGLLSDAYKTLQETQHSSLPRKEPMAKTVKHSVVRAHHLPESQGKNNLSKPVSGTGAFSSSFPPFSKKVTQFSQSC